MAIEWRIDGAGGMVRATLSGTVPLEEMLAMLMDVAVSPAPRPLRVLSDHRELALPVTTPDLRALVSRFSAQADTFGGTRWGVVVGSPASYGMIRMLSSLLEPVGMEVEPFHTPTEAEAWVLAIAPPAAG